MARCPLCLGPVELFDPGGTWSWVKWVCIKTECRELWGDDDVLPDIEGELRDDAKRHLFR